MRGRLTFLDLLAMLFLIQLRMLLAFFAVRTHYSFIFNLLATRSFSVLWSLY